MSAASNDLEELVMSTGPNEEQGYEGTGLGPRDHESPDHVHTEDEDLEHDGLGPHRGLEDEKPNHVHTEDEDLEHDGLGPHRGAEQDATGGSAFEPEEDPNA
jgi:hypothetical protein